MPFLSSDSAGAEEYSFDVGEFEKKKIDWGGYLELKWEHSDLNQDSSSYYLKYYHSPRSTLDRYSSTLQLDGNYSHGRASLNWRAQAIARRDDIGWYDSADIFEAFASFKPSVQTTLDIGKRVYKWGKGYAWNPAAFIDRLKDPNNPEEALEGFVGADIDLIRSFEGPLRTAALTGVVLPVWQGVNEDFGHQDNINLAVKLYLLYRDTDLDFMFFTGDSRSIRYGFSFARNLATNFEMHGEIAHVPEQGRKTLEADGSVVTRTVSDTSYLLGLRYLTESDVTTIVEYYRNGDGYAKEELQRYMQAAADGYAQYLLSGSDLLLQEAARLNEGAYGRPYPGREYCYARISVKEPFDILYITPSLTAIVNLEDQSTSLSPEILYTGITNLEMRLKFYWLSGDHLTEYGEKTNENRVELRLRWFF
ncbi:MAG: hypothetical protein Kow0089_07900 [Desulfobulbaceae bacterium]